MTVWKRSSEEPFQGALHEKQTIDWHRRDDSSVKETREFLDKHC
jgi:ribosomal protein L31E